MRVGLFQARWRLHSSTCYLAESLASAGYGVDLFLFDSDEDLAGDGIIGNHAITVLRLGADGRPLDGHPAENRSMGGGGPTALRGKARALYQLLPAGLRTSLHRVIAALPGRARQPAIPAAVEKTAIDRIRSGRYLCVIGVEKAGLAWAGAVARQCGTPLVYYSLELYTHAHPAVRTRAPMRRLKALEQAYHKQARLTLVQDSLRARVLLEDNGIGADGAVAFLPVSIPRNPAAGRSQWLHDQLQLPADTVVILVYGLIHKERLSLDLARQAQSFPDAWKLVFHGPGAPEVVGQVRRIDKAGRVRLSQSKVPMPQQWLVVGSARISLVLYKGEVSNDRLTGRSSEKIALSLQCGIPIVAFRYESYEHLEEAGCGVFIDSLGEIQPACERILADHAHFSRNATAAYERFYCFENAFEGVLSSLRELESP